MQYYSVVKEKNKNVGGKEEETERQKERERKKIKRDLSIIFKKLRLARFRCGIKEELSGNYVERVLIL